jgi:predicted transcriptional regulator
LIDPITLNVLARNVANPHLAVMSTHEAVLTIIQKLPPDVSLHEVAREIEFIAGVREGMAELDRGEGVPIEDVRAKLREWVKS